MHRFLVALVGWWIFCSTQSWASWEESQDITGRCFHNTEVHEKLHRISILTRPQDSAIIVRILFRPKIPLRQDIDAAKKFRQFLRMHAYTVLEPQLLIGGRERSVEVAFQMGENPSFDRLLTHIHHRVEPIQPTAILDLMRDEFEIKQRQLISQLREPEPPTPWVLLHLPDVPPPSPGSQEDSLWDQHVAASVHTHNENMQLRSHQYELLTQEQLSQLDPTSQCPICLLEFNPDMEVAQTHCTPQGHLFCKSCLETHYHYQQTCPLCRGKI